MRAFSQNLTRRATIVVFAVATAAFLTLALRAAPSRQAPRRAERVPGLQATFPVETIRVGVFDGSGAPVTGLSPGDFIVREDGEEQEVLAVEGHFDVAVDVVLLLDQSGSMSPVRWPKLTDEFLQMLSPQRDCVLLVRFTEEVSTSTWRSPDDPTLIAAIAETRELGGTALFDALAEAMRQLFSPGSDLPVQASGASGPAGAAGQGASCPSPGIGESPNRRRAIVAVTDGADTSSTRLEANRLKMAVQAVRAPIFHVDVASSYTGLTLDFRKLTIDSGGDTFRPRSEPFEQMVDRIRHYYTISYRIPSLGREAGRFEFARHEIDIETPGRRATLLHRPLVYRPARDAEVAETHLQEGVRLFSTRQWAEALATLDESIAANPYLAAAHAYRAQLLQSTDRAEEAFESARSAVELEPAREEYHRLMSDLARDLGRYDLAWAHAVRAVQMRGSATEILEALAATSTPPDDLDLQLVVPRLVVLAMPPAQPDLLVRAALPGAIRAIQVALSEDPGVGLVADFGFSQYVVWVGEKELSDEHPRRFKGRLMLTDRSGDDLYEEDFTLDDIDDPAACARDLDEQIREIVQKVSTSR